MQQPSPTRYEVQVTRISEYAEVEHPLFGYSERDVRSNEVIYSGHAGDLEEADRSAHAYLDYLLEQQPATAA